MTAPARPRWVLIVETGPNHDLELTCPHHHKIIPLSRLGVPFDAHTIGLAMRAMVDHAKTCQPERTDTDDRR